MENTEEIQYILEMYEALTSIANNEFVSDSETEKCSDLQREVSEKTQKITELNKKITWLRNKRDEYKNSLDENAVTVAQSEIYVENANLQIENSDLKLRIFEQENSAMLSQLDSLSSSIKKTEDELTRVRQQSLSLKTEIAGRDDLLKRNKLELNQCENLNQQLEEKLGKQSRSINKLKTEIAERDDLLKRNKLELNQFENLNQQLEEKLGKQSRSIHKLKTEIAERDDLLNRNKLELNQFANLNQQLEEKLCKQSTHISKLVAKQTDLRSDVHNLSRENHSIAQEAQKEGFRKRLIEKSPMANVFNKLSTFLFKISKKMVLRSNWVKRIRKDYSSVEQDYHRHYQDIEEQDWLKHILENGFIEGRLNVVDVSDDMHELDKLLRSIRNEERQK